MNGIITLPLSEADLEELYIEIERKTPPLARGRAGGNYQNHETLRTERLRPDNFNREYTSRRDKCQTLKSL